MNLSSLFYGGIPDEFEECFSSTRTSEPIYYINISDFQRRKCTVAKSSGNVNKFRTPSLTAAVPDIPSSATQTCVETSETLAVETSETVPSRTVIEAADTVTTSPPLPQVIGINTAFIAACTYPDTKETTELSRNHDHDSEDLISNSSVSSGHICRICQDKMDETGNDRLISPCGCSGSTKYVHQSCLKTWTAIKGSTYCEICQQPYSKEYVRIPCCISEDFGTHLLAVTMVVILLTFAAAGIFLLIDNMGREHSDREEKNSKIELYIAISFIIPGLLGIVFFIPYAVYCFYLMIDFRCRRIHRRRLQRRVTSTELNV